MEKKKRKKKGVVKLKPKVVAPNNCLSHTLLTDFDVYLFKQGKHTRLYEKFGAHAITFEDKKGMFFAVYAPGAKEVQVIGDFNEWKGDAYRLFARWDSSGIWEGFIPKVAYGEKYKYRIKSHHTEDILDKADPFAFFSEVPSATASITYRDNYEWADKSWLNGRAEKNTLKSAISIYELHLPSWRRNVEENRSLNYREMAAALVPYIKEMGFTHVEFMPLMLFPYGPSWGYQITGYYCVSPEYGSPEDLKYLIDTLHGADIGVIFDWVPSHFPDDTHGLALFDGSSVYEHPDKKKGFHPDWQSLIFNYERSEVCSFLISSAHYWLEQFHVDGLRVDAVASMLYLDYSREEGEWEPNEHGGNHYLAAIEFIKNLNASCFKDYHDILMIAEESTAFPNVTKPIEFDGLGFNLKWMMGWMNDTLNYFKTDPYFRKHSHDNITFFMTYAFSENYVLPLSHDEVVHGKCSILNKMPGDHIAKFAHAKNLYSYMFTIPGAKMLFMGNEIAQINEWNFENSLDWHLLEEDLHLGVFNLVKDLNHLYTSEKSLYKNNFSHESFEWVDVNDSERSIISYRRKFEDEELMIICNLAPVEHKKHPLPTGKYKTLLNTDDKKFAGLHKGPKMNYKASKSITLPGLTTIVLKKIKEKVTTVQ